MDVVAILFIGGVFALAGLIKGVVGMGLPTVAMGLLALQMTPGEAAALLLVPSFITNAWQAAGGQLFPLLRRAWALLVCLCLGTWGLGLWAGADLLGAADGRVASGALGAVLALYGVLGLAAVDLWVPAWTEGWLSPLIGFATGMVSATTGIYMIPSVPYLQALGLQRDELVQALGITFTVSTVALAVLLVREGTLRFGMATGSLLALVPALVGMRLGQWLRQRVQPAAFRTCFFVGALLLGLNLAWRALD